MELQQLRYFVSVAELGNFTRAAERCLVSQPSLSQQIIKLEKELGRQLLERLGRRVRLTDAGRLLYDRASMILGEIDDVKREVTEEFDSGKGRVSIGAIPTVAPYLIPPVLKKFASQCPDAEVTIRENLTRVTIADCQSGELDIGVLALPIEEDHLAVEPLFEEELLVSVHAKRPLAKKRKITLDDIVKEPFILLSETHCLGEQIVRFCQQQDCHPKVVCESSQLLTAQQLVALDYGVSLIPEMAAALDRSKQRIYRSLSGRQPKRTLAMIWHKHRYQSPNVKRFIDTLKTYARGKAASLQ